MTEKSHQRPHGHRHEPHPDQAEAQAKHRAESEAEPFVDECAPEREELAETTQVTAKRENNASMPSANKRISPCRWPLGTR